MGEDGLFRCRCCAAAKTADAYHKSACVPPAVIVGGPYRYIIAEQAANPREWRNDAVPYTTPKAVNVAG